MTPLGSQTLTEKFNNFAKDFEVWNKEKFQPALKNEFSTDTTSLSDSLSGFIGNIQQFVKQDTLISCRAMLGGLETSFGALRSSIKDRLITHANDQTTYISGRIEQIKARLTSNSDMHSEAEKKHLDSDKVKANTPKSKNEKEIVKKAIPADSPRRFDLARFLFDTTGTERAHSDAEIRKLALDFSYEFIPLSLSLVRFISDDKLQQATLAELQALRYPKTFKNFFDLFNVLVKQLRELYDALQLLPKEADKKAGMTLLLDALSLPVPADFPKELVPPQKYNSSFPMQLTNASQISIQSEDYEQDLAQHEAIMELVSIETFEPIPDMLTFIGDEAIKTETFNNVTKSYITTVCAKAIQQDDFYQVLTITSSLPASYQPVLLLLVAHQLSYGCPEVARHLVRIVDAALEESLPIEKMAVKVELEHIERLEKVNSLENLTERFKSILPTWQALNVCLAGVEENKAQCTRFLEFIKSGKVFRQKKD